MPMSALSRDISALSRIARKKGQPAYISRRRPASTRPSAVPRPYQPGRLNRLSIQEKPHATPPGAPRGRGGGAGARAGGPRAAAARAPPGGGGGGGRAARRGGGGGGARGRGGRPGRRGGPGRLCGRRGRRSGPSAPPRRSPDARG